MAAATNSVWAIDLGNNSLKALRLTDVNGVVEVIDFDNIKHGKILSGKGVQQMEKDELAAISLRQFVQNHDIETDEVIISLPSQNSFARFISLPPVETKRIPEIIRFEAIQQIPFDINDVQWDWQLMEDEGSEERKVGIFAIKSEVITSMLEHFSREGIQVKYIQMAPMALYNYALYDRLDLAESEGQGIVVLNIGAEYSDLVVCTNSSVWQRCIPMGGDAFTKAISEAFRINFEKAEKLKRNATMSKYARQVLQAMKPVFAELASDIQRSIGFYTSSNPDTKLVKIVAMGGGTRMRGLVKYLQQSLQMPIERPDSFEKLAIAPNISAAKLHENVCDFGIVYGLGLQALGLGKIESNLLPRSIARSMAWAGKARYFVAAAFLLLLISAFAFGRVLLDKARYRGNKPIRDTTANNIERARLSSNRLEQQKQRKVGTEMLMEKHLGLFRHRQVIPELMQKIISELPNEENTKDRRQVGLYRSFAAGDVETVKKLERRQRKQIFITGISMRFSEDLSTADFEEKQTPGRRARRRVSPERRKLDKLEEQQMMLDQRMRMIQMGQKLAEEQKKQLELERLYGEVEEEPKEQEPENLAGFLVTMVCYSPYKDVQELLEPLEVGDNRDSWGLITRLKHLDEVSGGKNNFELYERHNPKHFNLSEIHPIEPGRESLPPGIGIESERKIEIKSGAAAALPLWYSGRLEQDQQYKVEQILIDPMTKEIISKVAKYKEDGTPVINSMTGEPVYEINDHWFELKMKFLWKNAPKEFLELVQKNK